ncbi:hypothetical protein Tco_0325278, partial [Tanacetum coccineum]
ILEEPASSTGTLSSLQQLGKDFSFGDQFFNDKPSDAKNEKTTAEPKAESMVSVSIQQDTSSTPTLTSTSSGNTFRQAGEQDQQINESVKDVVISSVKDAMRAPLRALFKDLLTSDMKEIMLQRMLEE